MPNSCFTDRRSGLRKSASSLANGRWDNARRRPKAPTESAVARVAGCLDAAYGSPRLQNPTNPLDDLIFIICSTLTHEANYTRTYRNLKRAYPTFSLLAAATEDEIASAIKDGGLSRRKARAICRILGRLTEEFGRPTLAPLRQRSDGECELFLTSLPMVGLKTARCVMLYGLGRAVFPVDVHCWRISQRLGWIRHSRRDGWCSDAEMNALQDMIDAEHRFTLHVGMVSLGRDYCRPQPHCAACPLLDICPQQV